MSAPTAIVLAAGVGSRLRPLTDAVPKCLVDLGGETILGRLVGQLAAAGVGTLVVATGYREAQVRAALAGAPLPVRCVPNPDHDRVQNVVSLARAMRAAPPGPVLKLDGDLVLSPAVLARVLAAPGAAAVALDDRARPDAEAMKVALAGGRARRFGKGLDPAGCAGESIGLERFDGPSAARLAAALERALAAGRTDVYYEDVYNDLLDAGLAMEVVRVGDLPWTEVDDLADLARARALVAAG